MCPSDPGVLQGVCGGGGGASEALPAVVGGEEAWQVAGQQLEAPDRLPTLLFDLTFPVISEGFGLLPWYNYLHGLLYKSTYKNSRSG